MSDGGNAGEKTPSYMRVDYALRRAKAIQRKMAVEGLRALRGFDALSTYRFIGFGGIRFVDFVLMHQQLGITEMISMEHEADSERLKRLEFNKPFRTIDVRVGASNKVLPTLPWDDRAIVWLDYDDPLCENILTDVATVGQCASSGSALLFSLPVPAPRAKPAKVLKAFRKAIGDRPLPSGLQAEDLDGWGWAVACRRVIDSALRDTIAARSAALPESEKIDCHQVYHFQYGDSSRMLTLGYVLVRRDETPLFLAEQWRNLPWFREGHDAVRVEPPLLTPQELGYLCRQLPRLVNGPLKSPGLSVEELEMFEQLYRHYPLFVEAIA